MSKETNLDAEIRLESGKSAVKKVLASGKIPSVIYGLGEDSINISVNLCIVNGGQSKERIAFDNLFTFCSNVSSGYSLTYGYNSFKFIKTLVIFSIIICLI